MNWLTRLMVASAVTGTVMAAIAPAATASARSNPGSSRPAVAAPGQAGLTGQVRDGVPLQGKDAGNIVVPGGLPTVAGAVVSLPGLNRTTTTNASGFFTFRGLHAAPGAAYTLTVRKPGFGRWQETGITLTPGPPEQIYVELHAAAVTLQVPQPAQQPYNGPPPGTAPLVPGGCSHSASGWTSQTNPPPTILVYLTGVHGPTDAGKVIKYSYTFYEQHVLPNEWIASWKPAALEAGSVPCAITPGTSW